MDQCKMHKRTDGWTGGRADTTDGPVQTNEVRCHVPAPCCWACRRPLGSCEAKSGQEAFICAGTILLLQCCSLLDVLLRRPPPPGVSVSACWLSVAPRGARGPMRAPPSAHFRNREGSCRNPWVLGRREAAAMESLPMPEAASRRASSQAPHLRRSSSFSAPCTWRMYRPPPCHSRRSTRRANCHHSKSDEVTVIFAHSISHGLAPAICQPTMQ